MENLDEALSKIIREYYYQITPPQEQRNRDIVKELHTLIRQREKELLKEEFGHAWIDSAPYPGKEYCLNCALYRTKELSNE